MQFFIKKILLQLDLIISLFKLFLFLFSRLFNIFFSSLLLLNLLFSLNLILLFMFLLYDRLFGDVKIELILISSNFFLSL